jgi:16S rRNA (cytosine967-C5)-methyltransferase
VPIRAIWADTIGGDCPARADTLRLSPARNGTDGFFVAVMERKPAPKAPKKKPDAGEDENGGEGEGKSADG